MPLDKTIRYSRYTHKILGIYVLQLLIFPHVFRLSHLAKRNMCPKMKL